MIIRNFILVLAIIAFGSLAFSQLVIPQPLIAQEEIPSRLLPSEDLFRPLVADIREPQFSMRYARYHLGNQLEDRNFNAAAVAFGGSLPVYSLVETEADKLQIGIDGGLFALFDLDTESDDLQNTDFLVGIPLSYRHENLSARFRFYHNSSHLGDEYVINNPDVERDNPSYEDTQALLSYEWKRFRTYGGGGFVVRSKEYIPPWHMQAGLEYRERLIGEWLELLAAADLQSEQRNNWNVEQSYQLGLALAGKANRELRLMAEYVNGYAPEGQFNDYKLEYLGFALYFYR